MERPALICSRYICVHMLIAGTSYQLLGTLNSPATLLACDGRAREANANAFAMAGGVEVYAGWLWRFPPVGRE